MSPSYTHTLLSTRLFVRDMALLAEGLVMVDMHTAETAAATIAAGTGAGVQPGGFWSFDADAPEGTAAEIAQRRAMESRERHPFWAPDKVGEVRMRPRSRADACEVSPPALPAPLPPATTLASRQPDYSRWVEPGLASVDVPRVTAAPEHSLLRRTCQWPVWQLAQACQTGPPLPSHCRQSP